MKRVTQVGDNCFGACLAMLTDRSQYDFPIEGFGPDNKDKWFSTVYDYGYSINFHTELPAEPCIIIIELSDNPEYSHAVVIDENRNIIDPAGTWDAFDLDDILTGCNITHSKYITLWATGPGGDAEQFEFV